MRIIDTTAGLAELCTALAQDEFVTVDTEFMRERTYWPELCLIQIAGEEHEAIIDPMAPDIDLKPFFTLMADSDVLKVFHAARQDVEIVHHLGGIIPHPLFDTQIAAMVCGFGDQIGYEALVNRLAGAHVDKSSRFTDWARRPLTDKQLAYALSDVTHLRVVYNKLKAKLDESKREPWLEEEMDILTSPDTYVVAPENAWQRIKFRARKPSQLGVLMQVTAWRENEAQTRNVPRNRVVKDDVLTELAVQQPKDKDALRGLRALAKGHANSSVGESLLTAVRAGMKMKSDDIPFVAHDKPNLPEGTAAAAEVLKLALKVIAEREGIAPKLIASSSDIEQIAAGQDDVRAMRGWRRKVFGDVALEIKAGHVALGLKNKQTALIPINEALKAAE